MERIEYDSPEAAKFVTGIEGWVDRHGRFWGKDERMARWSGCTHKPCEECGASASKSYVVCDECREKRAVERYKKLERREWNLRDPLYSEGHDQWFYDDESIWDYIVEHGCTLESLRLVTAKPQYLREIDIDYFVDELPEDEENLPDEVQDAINTLNNVIRKTPPVSWVPDKYAAIVEMPQE